MIPRKNRSQAVSVVMAAAAAALLLFHGHPAFAFHPLNTDDPGTTEFRHFELEYGHDLIWPEETLDEASGYLAIKSGLAPGLEFDAALNYVYMLAPEVEGEEDIYGFGDSEALLKYRFLGDGDGPFNLGVEGIVLFPSGDAEQGLSEEEIIPTLFMFGTVGHGPVRALFNLGGVFHPVEDDTMLYGAALEWAAAEQLTLVAEVYGESDLVRGGGNDPLEGLAGLLYSPADWLTLSLGAGIGLAPDAPEHHLTFAVLLGW